MRSDPPSQPRCRSRSPALLVAVTALASILCGDAASLAATDAQRCERAVLLASAKYMSCIFRVRADAAIAGTAAVYAPCENLFGKHVGAAHRRFGTACPPSIWTARSQRFVDLGDGTVRDEATGLEWEKKRNLDQKPEPNDPHDADNVYTWTTNRSGTAADGTAFTTFLAALNGGECFAQHCDWRLPSLEELQMLLVSPLPCSVTPCIDPIFGSTAPSTYWSGTESAPHPVRAWYVGFSGGFVTTAAKISPYHVRAVRRGR